VHYIKIALSQMNCDVEHRYAVSFKCLVDVY